MMIDRGLKGEARPVVNLTSSGPPAFRTGTATSRHGPVTRPRLVVASRNAASRRPSMRSDIGSSPRVVEWRVWNYAVVMTKAVDEVLAKPLRLDVKARAEIVSELLASLDGPPDPDAEAAWEAEIRRRVAALEAGSVELESWESVRRRIEKGLHRG